MSVITYYSSLALSLLADSKKKKNNREVSAKRGTQRRVREGASRSKNDLCINSTK